MLFGSARTLVEAYEPNKTRLGSARTLVVFLSPLYTVCSDNTRLGSARRVSIPSLHCLLHCSSLDYATSALSSLNVYGR